MSRPSLAWILIGVLGIICLILGIGRGALSGAAGFDAVKFTIAGVILMMIGTYKAVRLARRR